MAAKRKDLRQLAERVRDAGFTCEKDSTGHAWLVTQEDGGVLYRFSAHSSRPSAVTVIEQQLRSRGLLANGTQKEKEGKVAKGSVVGDDARRGLVSRMTRWLAATGGVEDYAARRKLSEDAVTVIEHLRDEGHVLVQFGGLGAGLSTPVVVARESVRTLMDKGMSLTDVSYARWVAVMDYLEAGDQAGLFADNGVPVGVGEFDAPADEPVDDGQTVDVAAVVEPVTTETPQPPLPMRASDLIGEVERLKGELVAAEQLLEQSAAESHRLEGVIVTLKAAMEGAPTKADYETVSRNASEAVAAFMELAKTPELELSVGGDRWHAPDQIVAAVKWYIDSRKDAPTVGMDGIRGRYAEILLGMLASRAEGESLKDYAAVMDRLDVLVGFSSSPSAGRA